MTKEQRLIIIDELISAVENIYWETRLHMRRLIDNAITFTSFFSNKWPQRIVEYDWLCEDSNLDAVAWKKGKLLFLDLLASIKFACELRNDINTSSNINIKQKIKNDKIFIVHGHNKEMELAVARLIEKLGLIPIILHEQPDKGRAIIEKFEDISDDVGFAIILLSADDAMFDGQYRARQNVILELGYFYAKLGRKNVIVLYDTSTKIERPSDISGVIYEPYDHPGGVWRYEVAQELKEAGYNVDTNVLT
ncbi:MAG: nucleotide-binding protein [Defluviitaleaceae bacterium]|nr:nucleotide-binding protein [Defluviitaleaceae bacterium]